jgi:hypothetical protein
VTGVGKHHPDRGADRRRVVDEHYIEHAPDSFRRTIDAPDGLAIEKDIGKAWTS